MTRGAVPRPPARDGNTRARRGAAALLGWAAVLLVVAGIAVGADAARSTATTTVDESLPIGPELYLGNCASCHGNRGQGTFRGPALIGVGAASAHYWLASGRMPLADPAAEPVRRDPVFSEEEIDLLVEYIASLGEGPAIPELPRGDVDLSRGGTLYRLNCASCHNWDGKGGALVHNDNAPVLHPVPPLQVAEAVRIGPGAMPRFTEEQLDDEALRDVVAYVDYLREPRDAGGFGLAHWGPSTETVAGFVGLSVLVLLAAWLGERRGG